MTVPRNERPKDGRDLVVFSLVAATIVLAGTVFAYVFVRNHRQLIGRELQTIAALKAADLVQWRKERLGDAAVFGMNEYFSVVYAHVRGGAGGADRRSRLLSWLRQVRESYAYDRLFLMDAGGNVLLAYPESGSDDPHISAAAPRVLEGDGPEFLDFYRNPVNGRIYLSVASPVGEGPDRGVIALRIDPERYLYPYVIRWPTESATAETLLVRRDGDDVLFLNRLRFDPTSALSRRIPLAPDMALPAGRAIQGQTGVFVGTDYRGKRVLSVLTAIEGSPWFMVARMDMGEIYSGVRDRLAILLCLMVALLAADAAGAFAARGRWRLEAMAKEAAAAASVLASEERLRLALAAAAQGLFDLDLRTGEAVVNDEYARMLGYESDGFRESTGAWADRLHPDDREIAMRILDEYLEGNLSEYRVEYRQRAKDGEWKWILSLGKVIERDEEGRPLRMLGTHTDISVQKETERALRASEARYRETLDGMLEGCQIISADWRYRYLNDAAVRYSMKDREELIGRTMMECYPGIESTGLFEALRASMEGRTFGHLEYEFTYPDGSVAWFENSLQPCAEGLFILSLDISDRKRREREMRDLNAYLEEKIAERTAELAASNRELEAFSYSVAHDLRAPLRSIDGFARILQDEYAAALDSEGTRLLEVIRGGARKLDVLIHDLLDVSRIGRTELALAEVDMRASAVDAFLGCADPANLRDFDFSVGELPPATADRLLVARVWANLLSNAVKYSMPSATHRIEVSGELRDGMAVYSVRDRGVGFDQRYADKLFGMFQRLHGEAEFDGSGIGLAIARRIIERHGGRTWAEGRVGEGAAFSFSLPTRS